MNACLAAPCVCGVETVDAQVWVFYVDERNVPHDHPDSNHKLAIESFLGKVG